MFFGSTMMMVTVALVMAVIVTNLYAKKDSSHGPPRWVVKMALKLFPSSISPALDKSGSGCHRPRHGSSSKHDCNGRQSSDVLSITDGELDSLTCGCCCHCQRSNSHRSSLTQIDIDRIEAEWRLISKFVDRVFFWVFVALSTSTQTVLIMHMVPRESGYSEAAKDMEAAGTSR